MTRSQKTFIRAYAVWRERRKGSDVREVRLLMSGDVRAYCADGCTYLVDPISVLWAECATGYFLGAKPHAN
jgi:hypothetical protein